MNVMDTGFAGITVLLVGLFVANVVKGWLAERAVVRKRKRAKEVQDRIPLFKHPAKDLRDAYTRTPNAWAITPEQRLDIFPDILDDPRMARHCEMWLRTSEGNFRVDGPKSIVATFIDEPKVELVFPTLKASKAGTVIDMTIVLPQKKRDIKLVTKQIDSNVLPGDVMHFNYTIELGVSDE